MRQVSAIKAAFPLGIGSMIPSCGLYSPRPIRMPVMQDQPKESRDPSPTALVAGVLAIAGILVVLVILNG